jgi:anti-sigma factor RsiW
MTMADHPHPPTEVLQDAVDGRLDASRRAALDAHLTDCEACRHKRDALAWVTQQVGGPARAGVAVPSDLEAAIRASLDAEDHARAGAPQADATPASGLGRRAFLGSLAAAATVLAMVWVGRRWNERSIPEQVAADFRAYSAGQLGLDVLTAEPQVLEARLQAGGLSFPARVFDFGMMNYRLVGGGVHDVAGAPSALFAYAGAGPLRMLCQMYAGLVAELPAPAERRVNDEIDFLVYREGDVTLVFWQEVGRVVCVLAANGEPEAAIKLAFAKAVRG